MFQKIAGSHSGLLCPLCFDALCAANGISLFWECRYDPFLADENQQGDSGDEAIDGLGKRHESPGEWLKNRVLD